MPATLPLPPFDLIDYNNVPTTPQDNPLGDIINALFSGVSGVAGNVVVFRPGDPSPTENVYTTWVAAFAALQNSQGLRYLQVDDTLAPATVPAGTYDFEDSICIYAPVDFPLVTLSLDDGVVFQRWNWASGIMNIVSNSNSPVVNIIGVTYGLLLERGANLRADGTAPFVDVGAAGLFFCILLNGGMWSAGVSPVVSLSTPTSVAIVPMATVAIIQDTVVGPGAINAIIQSTSAVLATQTGLTGSLIVVYQTDSSKLGYVPGAPADWVAPAPVNAQEAIDRLAAAVAGLLAGPIP